MTAHNRSSRAMQRRSALRLRHPRRLALCTALALLLGWSGNYGYSANSAAPQVPGGEVQAFVTAHLSAGTDYQPGDLISRSVVEQLFQRMAKKGWVVDDPDAVLERVLADDDVVVRQLRTKKGRAFWQEIRHLPGGIDRLDRIARMPQGKANVRDLIQKIPNGSSWIEGLTTTRRGERTGTQLSQSRSGRDFNQPTGRIYTADALLEALAGRVLIDSDRKAASAASAQTATQAD